ncbi:MAG: carbohydrate ABC transporter substrate-binding protein [Oscillospiraceae bacterium]|nr:carbohydrate ABC transporter substrate-binding protein [Oscillospiraceae bacterium]
MVELLCDVNVHIRVKSRFKEANMNIFKKALALFVAAAAAISVSACNSEGGVFVDTPDIDPDAPTGVVKYLTYETNFTSASAVTISRFSERYGGSIEVDTSSTQPAYFETLATRIATGDSPDLVRYEWIAFPHGMSYNMFTPLDKYLDLNDPLWSGIKDIAEQYAYNGKHYYVPYHIGCSFALNYNYAVMKDNGMNTDPMELVKTNQWTWSVFEDMLKQWCDKSPDHIGYNGVGGMSFTLTTGKKIIEIRDGDITDNLDDPDIGRCMAWIEGMRKNGLLGATPEQQDQGVPNGYVDPGQAFVDGNLLFLGMEPTWTYGSAKESLDGKGIANEMKFVPFPKDEQADAYYQGTDTFGYMIPAGAKNIKGALDWINLCRAEEIDPENVAKAKDDACSDTVSYQPQCLNRKCNDTINPDALKRHIYTAEENETGVMVCPSCGTAREAVYKTVWTEEQYDMMLEMRGEGDRFKLLFDNCYGFSHDVSQVFQGGEYPLLDGPVFGDISYTTAKEQMKPVLDGYLQPYRDRLKADASGEEVTTTPPAAE